MTDDMVEGLEADLPIPAPFPSSSLFAQLTAEAREASLDAWILCVRIRLGLEAGRFRRLNFAEPVSGFPFLQSYFLSRNSGHSLSFVPSKELPKERSLQRHCLLLFRRLLLETSGQPDISGGELFDALSYASAIYSADKVWKETLEKAWERHGKAMALAVENKKLQFVELSVLHDKEPVQLLRQSITQLIDLAKCSPQAAKIIIAGDDYQNALILLYDQSSQLLGALHGTEEMKSPTLNLFVCLTSLMTPPNSSISLLVDILYSLKSNADEQAKINPNKTTLLSSLVCSTTFIRKMDNELSGSTVARAKPMLQFLRSYRTKMSYLHPLPRGGESRKSKGKQKAIEEPQDDIQLDRMVKVSQVHEVFPDLSHNYILRLLNYFADNVEAVTAALLEPEFLPPELQDQHVVEEGIATEAEFHRPVLLSDVSSTQRKNFYDNDDFDNLTISVSQVHRGRKENDIQESTDSAEKAKTKAAIFAALANFDSDEDERDDTYDIADVGGAVDNTMDTDRNTDQIHEQILFNAWRSNPEIFARDTQTRMSQPRQQLRRETEMDNEQIEGWAIMLSRDASAIQRLERKYAGMASFGAQQKALAKSKWLNTANKAADSDQEEGDDTGRVEPSQRGMSTRARGGGRGRGASTAGSADDPRTQNARRKKEQGRGRGGPNHNRREGRARKMGRGFGAPPAA